MYSFMRRCLGILFGWAQLPMKWIWNMISGTDRNAFHVSLWFILCILFCLLGVVMEILVRRLDRPLKTEKPSVSAPSKAVIKEAPLAEPISEEEASGIAVYHAADPVSRPGSVYRPEPLQMPVFDEPALGIQSAEKPYYRRRGSHSDSENESEIGVWVGTQTIHTVEEMQREEPSRFSRLAKRAKSFINLTDEVEEPVYSRNVKFSDAFQKSVYPDASRYRKE